MDGNCPVVEETAVRSSKAGPEIVSLGDSLAILAEADHRIANHLALLTSYVRLKTVDLDGQPVEPSRASMHALLDGVSAQIAAIARLHRVLVTDRAADPIELGGQLHEVCAPFAAGLSGAVDIVEDYGRACIVRPDQVLPLSQIVAEVVTNAVKHARECGRPGLVFVTCRKAAGGEVLVEIVDRGGGFPDSFDPERDGGLGFRLVRGLGRQLGARVGFDSTAGGVRFRLALPDGADNRN